MTDYASVNQPHTLAAIEAQGQTLQLEDGSRWDVYSGFVPVTAHWNEGDMINVRASRDDEYPYHIINIHKNQSADARLIP